MAEPQHLPLRGIRVVEMTNGLLDMTGRILADFGAEVIKVEPARGGRAAATDTERSSPRFLVENVNKSSIALNPSEPSDRERLWALLGSADIVIHQAGPGGAAPREDRFQIDPEDIHSRFPAAVVLMVSDFGRTGPYRDFVGTDAVHLAMGTQLSRSGFDPREPCLVPFDLAYQSSAAQGAWAALAAYFNRLDSGVGDLIDFSVLEATIEVVDSPFGTTGTATAGSKPAQTPTDPHGAQPGRPQTVPYPIYPCADGFVRCLVLAPGQWRAMKAWLGDPIAFRDAKFDTILGRNEEKEALDRAYTKLFRDKSRAELAAEGQKLGIPIAPVLSLAEVLTQEHFDQRGAFVEAELEHGVSVKIPSGFLEIDGERVGYRKPAPALGAHNPSPIGTEVSAARPRRGSPRRQGTTTAAALALPLSDIRVIDFGSIVFGAEVGRLFADLGADVIKIENSAFPDKYRGSSEPGTQIARSFALGNRGRRSFGVDTKSVAGSDIVKRLVASADVVVSNYKPGTLESLGLGYDELRAVKPDIVWMSSSGFGESGAWSSWLAYGPVVRSASGLTSLWRYPDDPNGFGDTVTVYPDHAAARIAGVAILAALIRKRNTSAGANIRLSQAEVVLNHLTEHFARNGLGLTPTGANGAPWGVYQCAGNDQWCVICVRHDVDWANFSRALGNPQWCNDRRFANARSRLINQESLDRHVRDWTKHHPPAFIMNLLQSHGVPAGVMNRPTELMTDPHLIARGYLATQSQPGFEQPLTTVSRPFAARHTKTAPVRPSPEMGQHTVEICSQVLGMSTSEIDELINGGVLLTNTRIASSL